ncbi:MAG: hypothetical protein H6970_14940 [Gammaproteobacteria bacterium]|nr:hypothetical protein [Gammaproteobacteria bacterium]MCP5458269.1 hypothetical protein [Gammaproteobacteria bacterium]
MKKSVVTTLSLLSLLGLSGTVIAADDLKAAATTMSVKQTVIPGKAIAQGERVTVIAQVQAVDLKSRQLTVKNKQGDIFVIDVPEGVRRLDEINVGDLLEIQYKQALAIALSEVETGGINISQSKVDVVRADKDQPPAGVVREYVKAIATVAWIDKEARQVTLREARQTVTLKVPEDINLDNIEVGDQVRAIYGQELAMSITPASSEKAQEWNKP